MEIFAQITSGVMGIAGTILGVVIGGRMSNKTAQKTIEATHKNDIELIHLKEFNQAAVDFQCAFLEARQKLRDDPKADFLAILDSKTLLEHERAALRFRIFLSGNERQGFDSDWGTYFGHNPHLGDRRPPEKTPEDWDNEKNCKIFLEQIETLFSYAKLK